MTDVLEPWGARWGPADDGTHRAGGQGAVHRQRDVQTALGVAQSTASTVLADLQRLGYVREVDRQGEAAAVHWVVVPPGTKADSGSRSITARGGRPATAYAFTGATRLVYS